ncbi:fertility inhibition protein FinO [Gibbsiella quercinecans]|uniref:fertility inhibition protein FinO n=1 Tax=Gibbsiella quercinecans TaxID=929813 RepID=UPI00160210E4|nr:fertility inhibition protein FinO [Gibbsiella quercinecans]
MAEDKRPILSLKRDTGKQSTKISSVGSSQIALHRQVVNVSRAPKWKLKKQKIAMKAEKKSGSCESVKKPRQVHYLRLPSVEQAINTLKSFWPHLFDFHTPKLLAVGIRNALFDDIERKSLPLSHKQLIRCLKTLTRSNIYLSSMITGTPRYNIYGAIASTVTQEEEDYARDRMARQIKQASRRKKTHQI